MWGLDGKQKRLIIVAPNAQARPNLCFRTASPTLEVGRLEGDAMKGGLRLQGITPDAVDGLSAEPARDPLDGDAGLVRNCRLSKLSSEPGAHIGSDTSRAIAPDQKCSFKRELNLALRDHRGRDDAGGAGAVGDVVVGLSENGVIKRVEEL